jgi:hypothetical protein
MTLRAGPRKSEDNDSMRGESSAFDYDGVPAMVQNRLIDSSPASSRGSLSVVASVAPEYRA